MLIQFRVENHRSLRDEQTLSLVAAGDKAGGHVLAVEGLDEALVPVVAIYGANASGKSNVLSALSFLRHAIVDSQRTWEVEGTPQDPFRLSRKASEPSLYEVDIVIDGVRFRYGFQVSATRIKEEWLFAWPRGRKAMWFEREGDHFEFGKSLHGENETIRSLTRPNSLFLSAAAQNNHAALLPIVRYVSAWRLALVRHGGMIASGLPTRMLGVAARLLDQAKAADREEILQLLREADTGILDIRVEDGNVIAHPDDSYMARPPRMYFRHRAADDGEAWLPLASESAGTVALLDPAHNPRNAQLIFTTHDTNLLGSIVGEPALRRDQVWFTEKDDTGGTQLYPLSDFHPRKEENLERGYLQGRYGAVPFLGELVGRTADRDPGGERSTDDPPEGGEES